MSDRYEVSWHGAMWRDTVHPPPPPIRPLNTTIQVARARQRMEQRVRAILTLLHTKPSTMDEIAAALSVDRSTVSIALRTLRDDRQVERIPSDRPTGGRRVIVYGLPRGAA